MRNRPLPSRTGGHTTYLAEHRHIAVNAKYAVQSRILRWITTLTAFVVAIFPVSSTHGDQLKELAKKAGIRILSDGESSGDLLKKTTASLPLNQLSPESRQRALQIIENCNQFRKLPTLQYTIDEPMYRYLLQHPDVAVSTWRVMGISRFEMWQTGPKEYEAKAVDGTEGLADILYQDDSQILFICEGNYHNILLPRPLEASALIWFRATYAPNAEGTHVVTQKADVFVRFPSAGLSTVAKMLTPVTNSMMDRNLFEVSLYVSMMSRAVRDEPEWVVQVAEQLEGVLPQRKGELIAVARQPRVSTARASLQKEAVPAADRGMIMSPQLLFFDPPKDGTAIVKNGTSPTSQANGGGAASSGGKEPVAATPVSSSNSTLTITPASKAPQLLKSTRISDARPEKARSQSEVSSELQPAVPPAGPTATGPVGSGPVTPGSGTPN